jgi:hypothetical protein
MNGIQLKLDKLTHAMLRSIVKNNYSEREINKVITKLIHQEYDKPTRRT